VTALLEYFNLLTIFPEAYYYVDLILFYESITIFSMQNRLSTVLRHPDVLRHLLLASYFLLAKLVAEYNPVDRMDVCETGF